jgi:hypothetical protein
MRLLVKVFTFLMIFILFSCKNKKIFKKYDAFWNSTKIKYEFPLFVIDTFTINTDVHLIHEIVIKNIDRESLKNLDLNHIYYYLDNSFFEIPIDSKKVIVSSDSIILNFETLEKFYVCEKANKIEKKLLKIGNEEVNKINFMIFSIKKDTCKIIKAKRYNIYTEKISSEIN